MQPWTRTHSHTSTQFGHLNIQIPAQSHCCTYTSIKTDIKQFTGGQTFRTKKKNKSMKGKALHFVPGYISVGSIGFPELQIFSRILLHSIYFNGLSDTTKKNKNRSVIGMPEHFCLFPHRIILCTRCKKSFYKLLACLCLPFEMRNANDTNKPLLGKLKHKHVQMLMSD